MQTFTGIEYIKIAAANHFGLDKLTWQERIDWFDKNESLIFSDVEAITLNADEPILFRKTLTAYLDALRHQPTGYLMGIDATASGLQILACLIGCHDTARAVNLIDTGKREDVYSKVADDMADLLGHTVPRAKIKHPVMTTFYGSKEQPKQLFGEGSSELKAFYEILEKDLGGAMEVMNDIQSCWRSDVTENQWTLPDGHVARVKVMVESSAKIEVDELDHATFTHKAYVNAPSDYGISLAANVTHSIDGYVVREMVRRADAQGFELLTIHDSFWAHPNHMNKVRQNYIDILAEIAESDLLSSILTEITRTPVQLIKRTNNLADEIRKCEYALS